MSDTSSEAVAKNETLMLANDYGFDLKDVSGLDDLVVVECLDRPPLTVPGYTYPNK